MIRHIFGCNSLCKAFNDRRLSHARLTDQDRIVFCSTTEDGDHTCDLLITTDNRVELVILRHMRQIGAKRVESLVLTSAYSLGFLGRWWINVVALYMLTIQIIFDVSEQLIDRHIHVA